MACTLVTGGAGFIGSHVVEELVRRGETVRVLDDLSAGNLRNLAAVRDRIVFSQASLVSLEAIRPSFEGADHVVHLAALTSVPRSLADPAGTNTVNVGGTLNVLLAARDARVKRLVFASSAAVYGDHPTFPRTETLDPRPLSPYALTKLAGEHYCLIFNRVFGLEAVALRYFNVFGPRQNPDSPYASALPLFISACSDGRAPTVFGDGEQSRDFVYVENVVDATLKACIASEAAAQVINVGVGESRTINQTLGLLGKIFGRTVTPRYAPPREGDVRHSQADISRARQMLGYEPKVDFEAGLRRTVDWYRTRSQPS